MVHHTGQVIGDSAQVDGAFQPVANAATVWSASYRVRLNRRSTVRCTRRRTGLNSAATARVDPTAQHENSSASPQVTNWPEVSVRPARRHARGPVAIGDEVRSLQVTR